MDGVAVRIDVLSIREPETLAYGGARLASDAVTVSAPEVVIDVLPPGTRHVETGRKRQGSFRLPQVSHSLVLDAKKRAITHHRRGGHAHHGSAGFGPVVRGSFAPSCDEP